MVYSGGGVAIDLFRGMGARKNLRRHNSRAILALRAGLNVENSRCRL